MTSLSEHVGSRIRLYRKKKMMSLDQLAFLINKSKSTVSKYERGTVAIDIETLFDIAEALNISVVQLIDYVSEEELKPKKRDTSRRFFDAGNVYLYYYDGRKKSIVRGVFEIRDDPLERGSLVTLYLGIDSFAQYSRCKFLYSGRMNTYDTFVRIFLTNQASQVEEIVINVLDPLSHDAQVVAHLSGILSTPFMPVSVKCILSADRLEENEELIKKLKLSSEDLKSIRRLNMFTVA